MWTNPNEIADNGIDDDKNGYIDDVHGWDFVDNDSVMRPIAQNIDSNNNGILDEKLFHATFITGILSAIGKNMYRGFVPKAKIIDIRVLNTDGQIPNPTVLVNALQYILGLQKTGINVKVINYSIAHNFIESKEFGEQLSNVTNNGIMFVSGAGNDRTSARNKVDYPANDPEVIGVGAIDSNLELAEFSRYGENLSIVAPGKNVYSTVNNDLYFTESGTSFSTPFVVGAAAFVWSLKPELTREEMTSLILNSTTDLGESGKDQFFGYGLLNLTKILINAGIDITITRNANFAPISIVFLSVVILISVKRKTIY